MAQPTGAGLREEILGAFEERARIVCRAAEQQNSTVPMPRLHVHRSGIGAADLLTTTRSKAGPVCALPVADEVVFERHGEVLGYAPWADVVATLYLKAAPGYPPRHFVLRPPGAVADRVARPQALATEVMADFAGAALCVQHLQASTRS